MLYPLNMSRLGSFFGIIATLLLGTLLVALSNEYTPVSYVSSLSVQTASSTISVLPTLPTAPIVFPDLITQATSTVAALPQLEQKAAFPSKSAATTTPVVVEAAKPAPAQPTPPAAPVAVAPVAAETPLVASGNLSLDATAPTLRAALVNIICYAPAGSAIRSMSGSGVFIDPKGIILTNAHIAQYFLLADRGVSCTIRSGSPAVSKYKAALIYISPSWIHANAKAITQEAPIGTGEYDFALVAVTGSATSASLPSSFPSLPLAQLPPAAGTPIVIASYGAQFLAASDVQSSLYPTVVFGSVKDIYTFVANTIDALSLGGSAAAQEGSSGGGITDATGTLIGTITTSTVEGATASRNLGAITASYIRAQYASETGSPLDLLLERDPATAVADFASRIPALEAVLTANIH